MSAVLSVILFASSETVIVSGIITSLNCFTAGVWSACILAFSRLLFIDARDLTLTFSESNARAIVILPCLATAGEDDDTAIPSWSVLVHLATIENVII